MSGTARIEGDKLIFELHAGDDALAFRRRLDIPLKDIVSVSTERGSWSPAMIRLLGTGIPFVVRDGIYLTREGIAFYEMGNADKVVTVKLHHERYKKIVFEVEDKEATAKMINDALALRASQNRPARTA